MAPRISDVTIQFVPLVFKADRSKIARPKKAQTWLVFFYLKIVGIDGITTRIYSITSKFYYLDSNNKQCSNVLFSI